MATVRGATIQGATIGEATIRQATIGEATIGEATIRAPDIRVRRAWMAGAVVAAAGGVLAAPPSLITHKSGPSVNPDDLALWRALRTKVAWLLRANFTVDTVPMEDVMVQAYILVQTEVGKAADVAKEIAKIVGVTQAEDVTGPYDVIVRAEADNVDELGRLVASGIQSVDGITRTLTCPVVYI